MLACCVCYVSWPTSITRGVILLMCSTRKRALGDSQASDRRRAQSSVQSHPGKRQPSHAEFHALSSGSTRRAHNRSPGLHPLWLTLRGPTRPCAGRHGVFSRDRSLQHPAEDVRAEDARRPAEAGRALTSSPEPIQFVSPTRRPPTPIVRSRRSTHTTLPPTAPECYQEKHQS